jgi:hypothetical protein
MIIKLAFFETTIIILALQAFLIEAKPFCVSFIKKQMCKQEPGLFVLLGIGHLLITKVSHLQKC